MARLNLIVLRSRDAEQLAAFYSALGLNFVEHRHGSGPRHLASESDEGVFEIYPVGPNSEPTRGLRLGFEVDDVSGTVSRLLAAGAELVSPAAVSPWGLRAVITDPEGHKVELTQVNSGSTTSVR